MVGHLNMYWFISLDFELWIFISQYCFPLLVVLNEEQVEHFCDDQHYATNRVDSVYLVLNPEYSFNISTPAFDPVPLSMWSVIEIKKKSERLFTSDTSVSLTPGNAV